MVSPATVVSVNVRNRRLKQTGTNSVSLASYVLTKVQISVFVFSYVK